MKKMFVTCFMLFVGVTSSFAFNNDVYAFNNEMSIFIGGQDSESKTAYVNGNSELAFDSFVELLSPENNSVYAYLKSDNNIVHSYRITDGQFTEGSLTGLYNGYWGTLELFLSVDGARAVAQVAW